MGNTSKKDTLSGVVDLSDAVISRLPKGSMTFTIGEIQSLFGRCLVNWPYNFLKLARPDLLDNDASETVSNEHDWPSSLHAPQVSSSSVLIDRAPT